MQESLSRREKLVRKALDRLGRDQLLAFFRAIGPDGAPLAVTLLIQDLDRGTALEAIFLTGEPDGFYLEVKGRGRRFQILFGYAGGGVGDGGTWNVELDDEGQVAQLEAVEQWLS